jgi:acetyl-CoA acetyltransferase
LTTSAIVGLGMTEMGKVFGRSATRLAATAVRDAVADAGLSLSEVDGLLVSSGVRSDLSPLLAGVLGLHELSLLAQMNSYGATAGAMVASAAHAIAEGTATTVVCVFADTPLSESSAGPAWGAGGTALAGYRGWQAATGAATPNVLYALAARRHMKEFGTTSEQLGAVAVAQRAWAVHNPHAQMRAPITLEDHQASPWIAEPLHRLDCCLVSNGAVAVVVTSADRAADLAQPPVHLWGHGQAHEPRRLARGSHWGLRTPAARSGPQAMARAGVRREDIDLLELYDCYTYTVVVTLEDYGFCSKGEGGSFVADGRLGPGGELPCNTGGGQLSAFYMWGFTPLSEAIVQLRGQAGERQVPKHGTALVSGNGGILEYHSTLVLGAEARRQ